MKFRELKHLPVVALVAVGLALAGCGGGGTSKSELNAANAEAARQAAMVMELKSQINAALAALGEEPDANLGDSIEALQTRLAALNKQIADAAEAARMAAAEAARMAAEKTGKALYAALDGTGTENSTALNNIDTDALTLSSAGLVIDAAENAGKLTSNPAAVTLKAGDSAGSLGGWAGTRYAHTDTGTKIKNEALVYTNRGSGKSVAFADGLPDGVSIITEAGANKGYIPVSSSSAAEQGRVKAPAFTHSGTQNHPIPARSNAFYTRGTYLGAPGEYRCTGTCTSAGDGKGGLAGPLGGTWHFKPDSGAMISQSDGNYLYFGWWVSKDKDGGPTAASAFAKIVGDVDGSDSTTAGGATLTGSATYAGKAAGKYALDYSQDKLLDGASHGGHFTADAMLSAKFGGASDAGMTGTINNFRLNDGSSDPGWSVELKRGGWGDTGAINAPTGDDANKGTVWSIGGKAAPASGTWSGTMYDEMPGNPPTGDGNNTPTTVTGTFYSEYGTTSTTRVGRMVGAFGANKQ